MIYSCFQQDRGLYRYFEDDKAYPINADLPVPKLPRDEGRIGVPSLDAARPMPSGAKPIGEGWHARGMVVQCGGASLGALDDDKRGWVRAGMVAVGAATGVAYERSRNGNPLGGAVYGAVIAGAIAYFMV